MAHFNKRHYEAIAKVCQDYRHKHSAGVQPWPTDFEMLLADMFEDDNSRFDRERFIHACKIGSNVKAKTAHLKAVQS